MQTLNDKIISTRIFNLKDIFVFSSAFIFIILCANFLVRKLKFIAAFKIPIFWPVSECYSFGVSPDRVLTFAASLALFCFLIRYLRVIISKPFNIVSAALVLMVLANFIQGVAFGFILPITGFLPGTWQYYDQAVKIAHPMTFFSGFEKIQLTLFQHSITHPPGATLIFYWLNKAFGSPLAIAIAIAVFSVFTSGLFFYKIIREEFGKELSGSVTLLFLLIPAIQIYYLACLEALVASFLLGALFFFLLPRPFVSVVGAAFFLFLASCLTFLFAFILPVLFGYEFFKKRHFFKSGIILAILASAHLAIYLLFHYNYLNSFWVASSYENIGRATPLFHGLEYIVTRIEGVFEILIFFGPFLAVLLLRGMRLKGISASPWYRLAVLAVFTLLVMFIAGFFRTAETARICLFIYPYLMLPVAAYLKDIKASRGELSQVCALVFGQAAIMQLLCCYFW